MTRCLAILAGALLASTLATPSAHATPRDSRDWGRVAFDLGMGFLGEQVQSGPNPNLAMTLAPSARVEKPVSRGFTLGGLVSTGFWRTTAEQQANLRRNVRVDLDLIFKPRYAVRVGRGHMEFGLSIPVGFTLQGHNADTGIANHGVGYNVGALLGWQYFPRHHAGFLTEFGWKRHQTWHHPGEVIAQEFVLNVGFGFLL